MIPELKHGKKEIGWNRGVVLGGVVVMVVNIIMSLDTVPVFATGTVKGSRGLLSCRSYTFSLFPPQSSSHLLYFQLQ